MKLSLVLVAFLGVVAAGCASEEDLPDIRSKEQQALPTGTTQPDGDPGCIDDFECGPCRFCNASGVCQLRSNVTLVVCRSSAGPCDPSERCTSTGTCPTNQFYGTSTQCRAGGTCNPAEFCAGGTAACPADTFTPVNTGCTTDSNACTRDVCDGAGSCVHPAVVCPPDSNPCTDTTCNTITGCGNTNKPDSPAFACNDANPCTMTDVCVGGTCRGSAINCGDNNVCTDDSCNVATGACVHTNLSSATLCDDGSTCTNSDHCESGTCTGMGTVCPDDGNQCTTGMCNAGGGGACTHVALPPGSGCNADSNLCTVRDTCQGTACVAGPVNTCNDNNPCTADSCITSTGACVNSPTNEGQPCTIPGSNRCFDNVCTAGVCTEATPKSCNDNNDCTIDGCEQALGCTHDAKPASTTCDDGNVCTMNDTCQSNGSCNGDQIDCNDNDESTADSCQAGTCIHSTSGGSDGGPSVDAEITPGMDGSTQQPADDAGCGCRTGGRGGRSAAGLTLALLFGLVLFARRRSRR